MNKEGLVSILTPCYNGGKFVHRLLDSVLSQDYPHIQMIVVDDGSTDNTHSVVEGYIGKFEKHGYTLKYVYQENAGQAAAINKALSLVEGEYFIWPDADDYFCSNQTISKMVNSLAYLDSSYGYVRCWSNFVDDKDFHIVSINQNRVNSERLFHAFLDGSESHAAAGTYMFRMSAYKSVNPTLTIFDKYRPQNCQLLLPMAYKYKCYTIEEPLHSILLRTGSHSRRTKDYAQQLATIDGYLEIHDHTLENMGLPKEELKKYKLCCLNKLLLQKLDVALSFGIKKDAYNFYSKLRNNGVVMTKGKRMKVGLLQISPLLLKLVMGWKKHFS